jgi:hypothetical protein
LSGWELAGWLCAAFTAGPVFVYMIVRFATLGYYKGKAEGQCSPDKPHPYLKGKEGHG